MSADRSVVVTGGGRGIGRAIVERLADDAVHVVLLELDGDGLEWADRLPSVSVVVGDAADLDATARAIVVAESRAPVTGWVNNAAVFRDASLHEEPNTVLDIIAQNVAMAATGTAVAVRHFLAAESGGSIVNISSHQAARPVPGALPYATSKAAIEGMTRASAVDYGSRAIRCNAVSVGSVDTGRIDDALRAELAPLHPLGRVGEPREVADAVAWLLSDASAFVTGAVVPVDGGRAALGHDPEARTVT